MIKRKLLFFIISLLGFSLIDCGLKTYLYLIHLARALQSARGFSNGTFRPQSTRIEILAACIDTKCVYHEGMIYRTKERLLSFFSSLIFFKLLASSIESENRWNGYVSLSLEVCGLNMIPSIFYVE
jgi:hypothetical protein